MATRVLSDEQVAFFEAQGYLIVPGLFDTSMTAALIEATAEVQAMPEVAGRQMVYWETSQRGDGTRMVQRIENFYPYHDWFHELFDGPLLRGAVDQLFGEDSVLYKDKINLKMPGGDGFKLHQDQQAGWGVYAPIFITALVCIDEATIENGCLKVAGGLRRQCLIGKEWEPMTEADLGDADYVAAPTKPGDVIFFDSYAPHGSEPNLTDSSRRMLYVTYNKQSDGNHRAQYYADKRASFPPDIEREAGAEYKYRV